MSRVYCTLGSCRYNIRVRYVHGRQYLLPQSREALVNVLIVPSDLVPVVSQGEMR